MRVAYASTGAGRQTMSLGGPKNWGAYMTAGFELARSSGSDKNLRGGASAQIETAEIRNKPSRSIRLAVMFTCFLFIIYGLFYLPNFCLYGLRVMCIALFLTNQSITLLVLCLQSAHWRPHASYSTGQDGSRYARPPLQASFFG